MLEPVIVLGFDADFVASLADVQIAEVGTSEESRQTIAVIAYISSAIRTCASFSPWSVAHRRGST